MYEAAAAQSGGRQQQQHFLASNSSSTTTNARLSSPSESSTCAATGGLAYLNSNTVVKLQTPVLFCTNRGLHIRLTKATNAMPPISANRAYDIKFCDLERWSTNRANNIGLNDTIASKTFTVHRSNCSSSSLEPTKQSIVRFTTSYERIEEKF